MLKGMTPEQIDDMVLSALRVVAANGRRGRVGGKPVRLAGPNDGLCVYMRVSLQIQSQHHIKVNSEQDVLDAYRHLRESMNRLINKDLVFREVTGATELRTYWVVTE